MARAGVSTLLMSAAVLAVPPTGGLVELVARAGVGVIVYTGCALAFDIAGARGIAGRLARALQARLA
jgi:hypothetical protein